MNYLEPSDLDILHNTWVASLMKISM